MSERRFNSFREARDAAKLIAAQGRNVALRRNGTHWQVISGVNTSSTASESTVNVKNQSQTKSRQSSLHDRDFLSEVSNFRKKEVAWLYSREVEILDSFQSMLQKGGMLSAKQRGLLDKIVSRVERRHEGREVSGGAPGSRR